LEKKFGPMALAVLRSNLAEPMQRIMRYSMLLENLLKHTPTTHADHEGLEQCVREFKMFLLELNEDKRRAEQTAHYIALKQKFAEDKLEDGVSSQGVCVRGLLVHGAFKTLPLNRSTSTESLLLGLASINHGTELTIRPRPMHPVVVSSNTLPQRRFLCGPPNALEASKGVSMVAALCNDMLVLGEPSWGDWNEYWKLHYVIPLHLLWVVDDPTRYPNELVLLWPGQNRVRLSIDGEASKCVTGLGAHPPMTLADWHRAITDAVQNHLYPQKDGVVKVNENAFMARQQCELWSWGGTIVVEGPSDVSTASSKALGAGAKASGEACESKKFYGGHLAKQYYKVMRK